MLYFGVLKDLAGISRETLELDPGTSVGDAICFLRERASNQQVGPQTATVWSALAAAVNREYAAASTVLQDDDELALLPPVSGGC